MRKPRRWIERLLVRSLDQADYQLCDHLGFERYLAYHRGEDVGVGFLPVVMVDVGLIKVPSEWVVPIIKRLALVSGNLWKVG